MNAKKVVKRALAISLATVMILSPAFSAKAASDKDIKDAIQKTGETLVNLGTPQVGSTGGEWVVLGLARAEYPLPSGWTEKYYENVVSYVNGNINDRSQLHNAKSTDNSRIIIALSAIGKDPANVDGYDLLKGLTDMDYIKKQGINGPIFALIAFDTKNYDIPKADGGTQVTRDLLINEIIKGQIPSGGWSFSAGGDADPDITAMALQALAPYYGARPEVTGAVDKALSYLSQIQSESGGIVAYGSENSCSAAQVVVALSSLGIDPKTDSRFVKGTTSILDAMMEYYIPSLGGFQYTKDENGTNPMATEQCYYAMVAYDRLKSGKSPLYIMGAQTMPSTGDGTEPVYRISNPATGEHLFTRDKNEYNALGKAGWQQEGVAWNTVKEGGIPVYRVFNTANGDHLYTVDKNEVKVLTQNGWIQDETSFRSPEKGIPVYRLNNPSATTGTHLLTTDDNERNVCLAGGWEDEGVTFYAVSR